MRLQLAFARLLDQLAQRNSTLDQLRAATPNDALAQLLGKATTITAQARSTASDTNTPALERIAAASSPPASKHCHSSPRGLSRNMPPTHKRRRSKH